MPGIDAAELMQRGRRFRFDRELESALTSFRDALKADPDDSDVRFEIGAVLTDLARYQSARVEYRKASTALTRAIEETRDDSRQQLPRLYNDRGVAKALSGDLESSLDDFEEAIALQDDQYPKARRSLGRVLLALGRYGDARKAFEKVIEETSPRDDASAHEGLAKVHVANDDPEMALSEARQAIEPARKNKASLHLLVARALRAASGDEEAELEAKEALREAVSICETNIEERHDPPLAMYYLAHAHLEQKNGTAVTTFAEAIESLKRAHADSRHLFAAYAGYVHALSSAERFDEALRASREALALEAPSAEQRESLEVTLAYVLSQVGQVDKAVSLIASVRKQRSKRVEEKGKATFSPGWCILGTEGLIRLAAAQKYGDPDSWSAAVGVFERAANAAGDSVREADKAAYGGIRLAEGYARWQLGDLRGAAQAFHNAKRHLPEESSDQIEAENLERRVSLAQSFRLPRSLPRATTGGVVVLIVAATILAVVHRLSPEWASVVLGLAVLAVASWCLPVATKLRIGAAELTKEIGIKENVPFVDLSRGPLISGPSPVDIPRHAESTMENLDIGAKVVAAATERDLADVGMDAPELEEVTELKNAITLGQQMADPDADDVVRNALRQASIYALGEPAGEVEEGKWTESELLHFTIDDPATGKEAVLLPVFTAAGPMRDALLRNPDWQSLSVLQIAGGALLNNLDPDVGIVTDPWTNGEHRLPSRDEIDRASDEDGSDAAATDGSPEERPPEEP
jgi:tetratricopeptide (TPR) repeat protein